MYLLDTDTLTHLHAGNSRVIENLRALDDSIIGTTIITKIELLRGRIEFVLKAADGIELLRAQELLSRTEKLLSQIVVIPLDDLAAEQFDQFRASRHLRKIGRADLLIASIAITRRATLVTRNMKHFRQIPNVVVVNWVDG